MEKVIFINEPEKSIEEIQSLIKIVYNGFMALAMDYGYYVKIYLVLPKMENMKYLN